jgi:Autotransporter beta-domain
MKQNKKTRYKQKIALTIAGLFLASPSFAIELLSNGGFESGISGWSLSYSSLADHGAYVDSMSARTGSLGFQGYENVAPGVTLSQSVTSGSTTKTLSFLIKTVGGTGTIKLDDLSVTSSGSRWTVSGYRKENVADASNHLYLTLGGASSVELALTTSWVAFSNDFTFGPSSDDTQSSLKTLASRLRSSYNHQALSSNFPNSNTYDCNLFDVKGMCISAGGRYSTVDNPNSNSTAAVVTLGYKVNSNIRIGGFLDQSVNNNNPTGVHLSNSNPMMGAFAYWNQNPDGLGYQVKIANAYQDKDLSTTRDVIGTSEAGTGKTSLTTQSYVGELSYAFMYKENTLVRPYFALRHTSIEQDAYTETGVDNPLTYSALNDRTTSALMGVKFKHGITEKTKLTGSLGVEQDLHHKTDQLTASGVSGLTSENFSGNIHRTRPVASIGATYDIAKTQRLSGEVLVQQLPFQSTTGATAYFNYMIGF